MEQTDANDFPDMGKTVAATAPPRKWQHKKANAVIKDEVPAAQQTPQCNGTASESLKPACKKVRKPWNNNRKLSRVVPTFHHAGGGDSTRRRAQNYERGNRSHQSAAWNRQSEYPPAAGGGVDSSAWTSRTRGWGSTTHGRYRQSEEGIWRQVKPGGGERFAQPISRATIGGGERSSGWCDAIFVEENLERTDTNQFTADPDSMTTTVANGYVWQHMNLIEEDSRPPLPGSLVIGKAMQNEELQDLGVLPSTVDAKALSLFARAALATSEIFSKEHSDKLVSVLVAEYSD